MSNSGYIRDKLDIKFLILFILKHLDRPASFADITEMAMVDNGFGFFELSEAFHEMVASGHITEKAEGDTLLYSITEHGRETSELYLTRLPSSVRAAAQRAVIKVMARMRRDACIETSTETLSENHLVTTLSMSDGMDSLIKLELLTVNSEQAALLEANFKKNAEAIYNAIIAAMLKDY
jgi:predicted MarR family transcription regulator